MKLDKQKIKRAIISTEYFIKRNEKTFNKNEMGNTIFVLKNVQINLFNKKV